MIQKPNTPLGLMMLKSIEKYKETPRRANMTLKDYFSYTFVEHI